MAMLTVASEEGARVRPIDATARPLPDLNANVNQGVKHQ